MQKNTYPHVCGIHGKMPCHCSHQEKKLKSRHSQSNINSTLQVDCDNSTCCSADSGDDCCSSDDSDDPDRDQYHSDNKKNDGCCACDDSSSIQNWQTYLPVAISFILLLLGLVLDKWVKAEFFRAWFAVSWYVVAYIPVGFPVLKSSWHSIQKGEIFTEFFLMSVAALGAFLIGEYPEGVAVMLFYSLGELFQDRAVQRAKINIQTLLDVRPNIAYVQSGSAFVATVPEEVSIGEVIQIKVGEKIPLDGRLLSKKASLNTAALTGESNPQSIYCGESVMAGSINLQDVIHVEVEKNFNDSSISRILDLVQNASSRKSETELLVRKLAKIYTPIVSYLAVAIVLLPYFFTSHYVFSEWLYRALVFLVISCPCALVISIPLGYFGGLGAASQNGLLFKGAMFLDKITEIDTVVMDKTGTMTQGVFQIQRIVIYNDLSEQEFMQILMSVEEKSTHPIAKAIMKYDIHASLLALEEVQEIAGKGLIAKLNQKIIHVGSQALLDMAGIVVPNDIDDIDESIVFMAMNNVFVGYVVMADFLKTDAINSITQLRKVGVKQLVMLSGDKESITQKVAKTLALDSAKGGLLPEEKLNLVENLMKSRNSQVAFVGDGINDAPVLAVADVGIAMGGLGSDVAIEAADVIIQTDQPSKIATAIAIGKSTRKIIWQNIIMAFGLKAIILLLGVLGMASMWQAVFADVGVALLAIGNAVRLQKMHWD